MLPKFEILVFKTKIPEGRFRTHGQISKVYVQCRFLVSSWFLYENLWALAAMSERPFKDFPGVFAGVHSHRGHAVSQRAIRKSQMRKVGNEN